MKNEEYNVFMELPDFSVDRSSPKTRDCVCKDSIDVIVSNYGRRRNLVTRLKKTLFKDWIWLPLSLSRKEDLPQVMHVYRFHSHNRHLCSDSAFGNYQWEHICTNISIYPIRGILRILTISSTLPSILLTWSRQYPHAAFSLMVVLN